MTSRVPSDIATRSSSSSLFRQANSGAVLIISRTPGDDLERLVETWPWNGCGVAFACERRFRRCYCCFCRCCCWLAAAVVTGNRLVVLPPTPSPPPPPPTTPTPPP
ncbi:hypothetical protein PUN28_010178 [Cardiocondyla obscurior]|uniref:Uncharacterized protein n=1 Tax=Cardiocondyla obscurior TaxID=286306 RepID=A0AAW2FSQ2_9HYME